ncbi:hypothetical protein SEVIR_9G195766v4 [Setaria viridis]
MATPPPPKRLHGRSLLDLDDDLIPEILLRLPPHDPGCLVRCSAVCKPWRRLLTDHAFLRRYRKFHGVPPMLGVLFDLDLDLPCNCFAARFVRTTSFRPRALDHGGCYVRLCLFVGGRNLERRRLRQAPQWSPRHGHGALHCTLVGNRNYGLAAESKTIVEYDLGRRKIAFIDRPSPYKGRGVLMPAMGGGLGFAGVVQRDRS